MKIGFVGLGIMGQPMALNLLRAGYTVAVWNRTASRTTPLAQAGAQVCTSAREVASVSDVVITIVSDTAAVESVLFGDDGIEQELRPGSVVIDMSTISPRATEGFAERLRQHEVEMLDAPVSGGETGAKAATLSIMVGGDAATFARCRPVLESMGKSIVHAGPNGSGQKTKLVNQIVGAVNLLATVEGLRVAKAAGLDPSSTQQAVAGGAAGSWMLSNIGPKIIAGDFAPGFSIRLQTKDLRLADEFVHELGLDAPATALVRSLFEEAMKSGLAEQGNQGLYNLWSE